MKTKISLVLLGLGLVAGSAYAGAVAEPLPVSNELNLTAPDQSGMWSFGVTAVLMQPTNKSFDYANTATGEFGTVNGVAPTGEVDHHRVDEGYDWWFGADITYAFPGYGRDVTLAYEGLHGTDNADTRVDTLGNPSSGAMHSSFSGQGYLTAEGETDTNYDAGDLLLGQKIDVGERVRLHPFMGVRYAHIEVNDTGNYTGGSHLDFDPAGLPIVLSQTENSWLDNTFNGVGPRLGSDAQINLGQGFSLRGRLGLSALIGSHSIDNAVHITRYNADGTFNSEGTTTISDQSETRVIPEIDGRLGLNYTYTFNSGMALGVEAGWQATNYFNVITDQPSLDDSFGRANQNNPQNNGPNEHYDDTSNFGVQGPYARIQLDLA